MIQALKQKSSGHSSQSQHIYLSVIYLQRGVFDEKLP